MGRTDWKDPKDVAKAIDWIWDQRSLKDALEQRTARNIAFLEGRQWHEWDWRKRKMRLPDRHRAQYQLIFNQIKPLIYAKLAKLTRREPVWTVPAFTSDEFDQMVARYSNDIMSWYWNYGLNMSKHLSELLLWMFCSPVCWVGPHWDPIKGDPVSISFSDFERGSEGMSPEDAQAQQTEDRERFRGLQGFKDDDFPIVQYTGDIGFETVSIFKMNWYPFYVESFEQVQVYVKTDVMAPEVAATRYNVSIDEVLKAQRPSESQSHYEKIMMGWSSPFISQPTTLESGHDNGVMVHQITASPYVAPPFGAQAIKFGHSDTVLESSLGPLGNAMGVLPFKSLVENPTPGFAWGTCAIDDVICAQVDQNLTRTQQAQWRNQMVRPKIVRFKGDGAKDDSFKKQDSIIEVVDTAHMPQILVARDSGIEHQETTAWNSRYIHDAIGVPDVSLGRTGDTQARSGRAVLALQEESHERMKLNGDQLNEVMSWSGMFLLAELQHKAVAQRITPLVGDANQVEFRAWSRASLRPTIYEQDPSKAAIVTVTSFSNIPTTVAQSRQLIMELTEIGYLRPGQHDRLVSEVFGMNDFRAVLDRGRADRDKQETEISRWRQEMQVMPPSITDDDDAHLEILGDWIKTEEFSQLSVGVPGLGAQVMSHYDQHQQALHDKQARNAMRDQYAQMRVAAEFAMKAVAAGRPDWAQIFAMQSLGGLGGAPVPGDPNDQNARSPQPNQQNNQQAVGAPPGANNPALQQPQTTPVQGQDGDRPANPEKVALGNQERVLPTGQR